MLSGLVLAGGESTRMGRAKAALTLADGRTLLQRQVGVLRAAGATTVQVSIGSGSGFMVEGATPVADHVAHAGPLAGIAAGLRAAPAGLVLVLAVDMPAITEVHLRQLLERTRSARGVVPMLAGQCEPLAAIYPSALAASAEAWLACGRRAVHTWAEDEAGKGNLLLWDTPPDWSDAFRNWNAPDDLPAR